MIQFHNIIIFEAITKLFNECVHYPRSHQRNLCVANSRITRPSCDSVVQIFKMLHQSHKDAT